MASTTSLSPTPPHARMFPSWTRLGPDDRVPDEKEIHLNTNVTNNATIADPSSLHPSPTFSTPSDASRAYQSGRLKSDFNISSNHSKIRVAFRYNSIISKQHHDEASEGSHLNNSNANYNSKNDLILCWVGRDGIPHHFYPLKNNNATEKTTSCDNTTTNDVLLIDENDHIETTFPGHAFVFCRRVGLLADCSLGFLQRTPGEEETIKNQNGSTIVLNIEGRTMFMRKRKVEEKNNTIKGGSESMDNYEWEAFLVVGGYRPGLMAHSMKNDGNENAENNDDSESDDEGEEDLLAQLVTIQCIETKEVTRNKENMDEDENDDPPPKLFDCSTCIGFIPFLRGIVNPKLRHQSAFVSIRNSEGASATASFLSKVACVAEVDSLNVTVCMTKLDPTPVDTSTKHYDEVILGGWPCRLEPGCFVEDDANSTKTGESCTSSLQARFEADLCAACESLPPTALAKLKKSTPIWINKSQSFGPKAAPIKARDACFHPGSKWLVRNGMNPAKCGGVEFYKASHYLSDCDLWGPGGLVLHELSHAWHCLHTKDGYDNEDIKQCYNEAMKDGLYDCVRVHGSQGPECKAYACQDQMEYFAELSVAFLGGLDDEKEHNKWYPFNRNQLKDHDPRAFAMMCRIWNVDENVGEKKR